ncbi:xylulokinase [Knoellia subterranea]|uniref:Xylulose kinase n=1 Tax=Knoellia subterranea KCTC 19937 TaxID=1385521 RepID=A0A0A0JL70_9MICO|nr:xylulokinase [Knoellia subterranea]KGN37863.1 xylulokinase [Knoellia subterranea KCTC 19937]
MPSTHGQLVAGVDSSTQSCKVLVCDAETGEVVREGRASHPDGTEVDPGAWWTAYEEATVGGLLDGVSAISVGGQQHGMVTLDAADEVVRPALLWNDTRSAQDATDLIDEFGGAERWANDVGVVPVASFTVTKLRWLRRSEPDNLGRTRTCVLPHDWLTGRILKQGSGFERWTTDRGDASGTGYWSAGSGDYLPDVLDLAVGRPLDLPHVLGPTEAAGRTDSGLVVAPGTGDNMGAALGLGLRPGDAVISLGTSGTAFARHDAAISDASGAVASFADATGGFLPLLATLNAARVLTAGASMLGVDLAELDHLALAAEPGAGGLTLLPYLDGERTPNLPEATGSLHGLTRANATPENLARAIVEGMLTNLAEALDALRGQGVRVERVLLIGGASASRAVRALAADLFEAEVHVPASGEYVALGAARQAAATLVGSDQPDWDVRTDAVLEPNADAAGSVGELRGRYADLRTQLHGIQGK